MGKHATATQMVTGVAPHVVIHGRHVELSSRFREHVLEKLSRVDRFGVVLMSIDVEVCHEANPRQADMAYEVELTCRGRGLVIRAEARAADKWAALDIAYDRLEERLRRAADRRHDRQHGKGRRAATLNSVSAPLDVEPSGEDSPEELPPGIVHMDGPVAVREKEHIAPPMTVADAVDALELVGHDFYLFHDIDSDLPSAVYRRRGFEYGVIRLRVDIALD